MAKGNRTQGISKQFSVHDLPNNLKLKERKPGQNTVEEIEARNLEVELSERERARLKRERDEDDGDLGRVDKKRKMGMTSLQFEAAELDRDDSVSEGGSDGESSDDYSDDDESDDEEELLKELEKIKKERAEENERRELARLERDEREKAQSSFSRNPLLQADAEGEEEDGTVKKQWWEDTVFRNQAKDLPEVDESFINDSIRNTFHRKFMDRYIK
eukprot:CAMPEP_0119155682 /NCGR_PEP_ID=MMETSP1310-20130426/51852_1 /TAXON_ID=464262 /ORGANISM="Genus nov. species nov., Strain RCC2339" /LENGTH=215 /DNA_ID=CAMNT_0007148283 /DNA_START=284 /DNA_END=931 /DNA_ORIENTATION=-